MSSEGGSTDAVSPSIIWECHDVSPKVSAALDFSSFMNLSVQVDSEPWQASSVAVDQEVLHIRRWVR